MKLQRIAKLLEQRDDLIVNEVVLSQAQKKGQVIYGAKAYNVQSPEYLKKKTFDYDILTNKPKAAAKETASLLRRRLGKEVRVVKGRHLGTYRVKVDNEVVVDYTQIKKPQKVKSYLGNKYKDISSIKRNVQRILKKPTAEYRQEKDLDTLQRIKKIEELDKK